MLATATRPASLPPFKMPDRRELENFGDSTAGESKQFLDRGGNWASLRRALH